MSMETKADKAVEGLSDCERENVALGAVIYIVSATFAEAEKRIQYGDENDKMVSRSLAMMCLNLKDAIIRSGIDYDGHPANMMACMNLKSGQIPGMVSCASISQAGGARNSAFNHN